MGEDEHRDTGGRAVPHGARPEDGAQAPTGWGAAPVAAQGWAGQGWDRQGWAGQGRDASPKPGVIALRPLSVGELLDGSVQTARRNAGAMIGSALLFHLVTGVLTVVFLIGVGPVVLRLPTTVGGGIRRADIASLTAALPGLLLGALALGGVALVGGTLLYGALVIPVSRAVLDQRTTFGQMWSLVRPRVGALIGLALLLVLLGGLAVSAFLIGVVGIGAGITAASNEATGAVVLLLGSALVVAVLAVWIVVRLSVSAAVLVLERCGPGQALARSWRLTRGSFWRMFGVLALTMILAQIVSSIASAPLQFALPLLTRVLSPTGAGMSEGAVGLLIVLLVAYLASTMLAGALTTVFVAGVTALLYVDLRMRREGLAVALLAEHDRLAAR